jgi:hypothetical protein
VGRAVHTIYAIASIVRRLMCDLVLSLMQEEDLVQFTLWSKLRIRCFNFFNICSARIGKKKPVDVNIGTRRQAYDLH